MAFTALLSFLFFLFCSHSAYAQGERLVVAYSKKYRGIWRAGLDC